MAEATMERKEETRSATRTACVVVGGGPGGAVLALLLARRGVDTTLLEAHPDFDRDFRGDTIHPSVMEIMDGIGLAERLLELRHTELRTFTVETADGDFTPADFSRLNTKFPYITMMPQTKFLEFITEEAEKHPNFRLVMGARVHELIEEDGVVGGVRYRGRDGTHEVRAEVTIGADGRGSRVRRLAGIETKKTSPPMDVLWLRFPREEGDPEGVIGRFASGSIAVALDRFDHWQAAYAIPKGTYPETKKEGIEALKDAFTRTIPEFVGRLGHIEDWKDVSLLSVESSRCERWHKPGLLLIGDAAHVMSPVGGVGINYAIQDAVVAANVLAGPLKNGRVGERHLAKIQRRRELPTRFIQRIQSAIQKRVLARALEPGRPPSPPPFLRLALRLPVIRAVLPRIIGIGLVRVRVKE